VSITDDLQLALRLAEVADALTMARFRASDLLVTAKPDLTPVTEADLAVERALREVLAQERPTDLIVGEEEGGTLAVPGRRWIIDPIDGTKNYVRGVPVWATLIALVDGPGASTDPAIVGVVSAPALARRWWAARGQGAWCTSPADTAPRRMQVSGVASLSDASFSYSDGNGWETAGGTDALAHLRSRIWRSRAYGDFWSHMLVAEGAVDISAEPELNPWDVAALIPIIEEAGGQVTSFDGSPALGGPGSAVATNGVLHADVLALFG
jgi:histidinol-phosphatase